MGRLAELRGQLVYLDSNVFIYAMERDPPLGDHAQAVLALAEAGGCTLCTSELTIAECLTRPMALGQSDVVRQYLLLLQSRPSLELVEVNRHCLIQAAGLRGQGSFKLPDAIHIATARQRGCSALVSNDQHLIGAIQEGVLLSELLL